MYNADCVSVYRGRAGHPRRHRQPVGQVWPAPLPVPAVNMIFTPGHELL